MIIFLTMSISPQGIVETHALLEDFLLLNQLPSAIFLHSTHSFILVNKNINKTSIIATVNTRISQTKTMLADSADHQEAWRSSSSRKTEEWEKMRTENLCGESWIEDIWKSWKVNGKCGESWIEGGLVLVYGLNNFALGQYLCFWS